MLRHNHTDVGDCDVADCVADCARMRACFKLSHHAAAHPGAGSTPPDFRMTNLSRTVGETSLVDEFVMHFTHSTAIDWLLPGVPPTGKYVEVVALVVVKFEGDKLASEHIHWDQATVLVQVGLLDPRGLPVLGAAAARKALDRGAEPSNTLMAAAWARSEGLPIT